MLTEVMLGVIETDTVLAAAAVMAGTTTRIIMLNYLFSCINSGATGTNHKVSIIRKMECKGQHTCVGEVAYK